MQSWELVCFTTKDWPTKKKITLESFIVFIWSQSFCLFSAYFVHSAWKLEIVLRVFQNVFHRKCWFISWFCLCCCCPASPLPWWPVCPPPPWCLPGWEPIWGKPPTHDLVSFVVRRPVHCLAAPVPTGAKLAVLCCACRRSQFRSFLAAFRILQHNTVLVLQTLMRFSFSAKINLIHAGACNWNKNVDQPASVMVTMSGGPAPPNAITHQNDTS